MANQLNITQLIARAGAASFHAKAHFMNTCDKRAAKEYFNRGVSPGQTLQIPQPARFNATLGITAHPDDTVETKVPLTVVPITAAAWMTSQQKLLFMESPEDFEKRIALPLGLRLVRKVEEYVIGSALNQMSLMMGSPGTAPGTYKSFSDARARMLDMLVPDPDTLMAAISPTTQSILTDNLKALMNPPATISNQYVRNVVKDLAGFKAYYSQSLQNQRTITAANLGTPLVRGSGQTGSNLLVDGFTAFAVIPVGSNFTLTTPYSVDPESKKTLSWLQTFTVIGTEGTDDEGNPVFSDIVADGSGIATLPIYPPIIISGNQQTVTVSPTDDTAVTFAGGGGVAVGANISNSFEQNICYAPEAIAVASFPFQPFELKGASHMETFDDISIRVSILPEGIKGRELIRMDTMVGVAVVRPEWCVRLAGVG